MFTELFDYIENHEDEIMGKILYYSQKQDYTKYTSSLKEAWRLSVAGISKSFIESVKITGGALELNPNEDYEIDFAAQYGILQAHRHRERGVTLDMFIGLMKYYRQSYKDLIEESIFEKSEKKQHSNLIERYFDRVEIGFCNTWASAERDIVIKNLQNLNRHMTNEKNKYLTIFESLSMPVFIVTKDGIIENMNFAASNIFYSDNAPGEKYYEEYRKGLVFVQEFPWFADSYMEFLNKNERKCSFEKYVPEKGKYFNVSFSQSLDLSGKFTGTVVITDDITSRKQIEKELECLANADPLTGANNRRSFLHLFEKELLRSQRHGHSFSLLMIDIDYFKKINDAYGHDVGDKVLKLLVAESLGALRGSDLFGRWGGEEFIALLPEADMDQATSAAERLRANIAKSELRIEDGSLIKFTVSIGVTMVMAGDSLSKEIFKKADDALYLAKQQGRNRVVLL